MTRLLASILALVLGIAAVHAAEPENIPLWPGGVAYAQGSHGDSLDPRYGPTTHSLERCEEWLRFNAWLGAGK